MKRQIIFIMLLVLSVSAYTQQEYFIKSYGGTREDYFSDVAPMPNGGYMAVGSSKSFGDPDTFDGYIVTTDAEGNQTKSMGVWGAGDDEAAFIRVSPDSSFYVCFNSQISTGVSRTQLLCIDDTIGWKWTSPVYNTANVRFIDGCFLPDGTFVVVGKIDNITSVALWFDQTGDTIFSKVLSRNDSVRYTNIRYKNDTLILHGFKSEYGVFIETSDLLGNIMGHYEKKITFRNTRCILNDERLLFTVDTKVSYIFNCSAINIENDTIIWQNTLGMTPYDLTVYNYSLFNNDFLICGNAFDTDTMSGYLVKIDEWSGIPLWEWYYKPYHSKYTKLYNVKQYGNKILCVGTRSTGTTNGMDALLIVADENGWAGIREPDEHLNSLEVYPNPVKDIMHITLSKSGAYEYLIFDLYGRMVRSGITENSQISTSGLSKGLYIIKLMQEGQFRTAKFVKE